MTSTARRGSIRPATRARAPSDEANLDKLIREVDAVGGERRAAYVCVLALIDADGTEHVFGATCAGRLLRERRGSGGFGYDPIFVPDDTGPGDERTMSELSPVEKNAISHRGRAARLLAAHSPAVQTRPGEGRRIPCGPAVGPGRPRCDGQAAQAGGRRFTAAATADGDQGDRVAGVAADREEDRGDAQTTTTVSQDARARGTVGIFA